MHGGEEIWECVCASIRSSGFFSFWLRDRCKLKKRKARGGSPGLSRGVVKLTGRPARNAARARDTCTYIRYAQMWVGYLPSVHR